MAQPVILFVDDEPNVTQAMKRSLHREPWEIHTATSARQAMEILESNEIDVVISDERMPGVPGSVFLSQVRELYPDTIRIILSGQANLEDAVRAINMGEIYRFLLKPVNMSEFVVTIRQALLQKELVTQSRRLLKEYQRSMASLSELERLHPGITRLELDEEGAILLNEQDDVGIETLLGEISAAIGD